MGRSNWGGTATTLGLIDAALTRGVDVAIDMYPYTVGATTLAAALPTWADVGGDEGIRRLLADRSARERLLLELDAGAGYVGLDEVVPSSVSQRWRYLQGRPLVQVAAERGVAASALLLDVLADEGDRASMLVAAMAEDDVARVMAHPAAMVGSDGWVLSPTPAAHPRNFATFVRTLVQAGKDEQRLAEAVRRQTATVTDRFRLTGRGRLSPGYWADVVVADLEALDEGGGFADSGTPPDGIRHVFVNGVPAYGVLTSRRPSGRVLRRQPKPTTRRRW
jgi:N-acyl-D-amino-acid deacylase